MEIKRFDPRLWLGVLLVFGGLLALLDAMGVISNWAKNFRGLIFAAGGALFLYMLIRDSNNWWAAFPAFTLLGLAVQSFLPESLEAFDGFVVFAGISLAFWWVYFTDTTRWWAIIPAGVLLTLGTTSAMDNILSGDTSDGLFFIGLGITFILVAILPRGSNQTWAYFPGIALVVFGTIRGTLFGGITGYIWPVVLISLGGYFVLRFFTNRSAE